MEQTEQMGDGFFSPFTPFSSSRQQQQLLELWEAHYRRLGIETKRVKQGDLTFLAVNKQQHLKKLLRRLERFDTNLEVLEEDNGYPD